MPPASAEVLWAHGRTALGAKFRNVPLSGSERRPAGTNSLTLVIRDISPYSPIPIRSDASCTPSTCSLSLLRHLTAHTTHEQVPSFMRRMRSRCTLSSRLQVSTRAGQPRIWPIADRPAHPTQHTPLRARTHAPQIRAAEVTRADDTSIGSRLFSDLSTHTQITAGSAAVGGSPIAPHLP